jgi:hypothetical protein
MRKNKVIVHFEEVGSGNPSTNPKAKNPVGTGHGEHKHGLHKQFPVGSPIAYDAPNPTETDRELGGKTGRVIGHETHGLLRKQYLLVRPEWGRGRYTVDRVGVEHNPKMWQYEKDFPVSPAESGDSSTPRPKPLFMRKVLK